MIAMFAGQGAEAGLGSVLAVVAVAAAEIEVELLAEVDRGVREAGNFLIVGIEADFGKHDRTAW